MFTGLIQAVGSIQLQGNGVFVKVPDSFSPLHLGESISVNGVCLTVSALRNNGFSADISQETLKRTALWKKAADRCFVNLEKALRLSDRLGGHLVSGHVDGLGKVISIKALSNSWNIQIAWENDCFTKYTCNKASISLDGVSLTVAERNEVGAFLIAVIPHTWVNTSLQYLKEGELVNLEADLMAKYAENLLKKDAKDLSTVYRKDKEDSDISEDWLTRNGFT